MRRLSLLLFAGFVWGANAASGAPVYGEPPAFWNAAVPLQDGAVPLQDATLPTFMVGKFVDDYGIEYSISDLDWQQAPGSRFHIVEVDVPGQYLVARDGEDAGSSGRTGDWVRIDWVELDDGGEYPWAFCYAAYEQRSRQEAIAAPAAHRETPRTGCNGFPFSRMKPAGGIGR